MEKKCPGCGSEFPRSAVCCPHDGKKLFDRVDKLIGLNLEGKYFLEEFVGQDTYGTVYLAKNRDEQDLVVKVLNPYYFCDQTSVIRFQANLRQALSINHPHIQKVLDGGVTVNNTGHLAYFVPELETGYTLENILTHTQSKKTKIN